ncbi:unnamed protein product [Pylaiella littoralis]
MCVCVVVPLYAGRQSTPLYAPLRKRVGRTSRGHDGQEFQHRSSFSILSRFPSPVRYEYSDTFTCHFILLPSSRRTKRMQLREKHASNDSRHTATQKILQ